MCVTSKAPVAVGQSLVGYPRLYQRLFEQELENWPRSLSGMVVHLYKLHWVTKESHFRLCLPGFVERVNQKGKICFECG